EALAAGLDAVSKVPADECPSRKFVDAPEQDNWAHAGIDYCVANGLMKGISDTVFSPAGSVTRAQLVTILYRLAGEPAVAYKGTFSDVADGLWYSDAIEWAAANGIVNGVGEGKFNPDGKITREQIAAILYRYSGSPKVEGSLAGFPDAASVSDYAVDAMIWATSTGLINGIGQGDVTILSPKTDASRAQIASIIMRYAES
ncbi:MAG: S-layer homology domain-containing protein, partial [Oscillospiraceae bacterium]|nr:S-layer homology domain-containing protein [Oscillospiraceae bacterium]